MSNFLAAVEPAVTELTLQDYVIDPDGLLRRPENRRDFINKFILDLSKEEKVIHTLSHNICLQILNINFYNDVIIKSRLRLGSEERRYAKFSDMPKPNQDYYDNIKKTLFLIYVQYIVDIPLEQFSYNNVIAIAQRIKDVWLDTNVFVLDLLLELCFVNHIINPTPGDDINGLNTKIKSFYTTMKNRLGIIDNYNLQRTNITFNRIEFTSTPYSLTHNESIYNEPPLLNAPVVEIPENYEYTYVKPRNVALKRRINSLTTDLPINVRPVSRYTLLSSLYNFYLNSNPAINNLTINNIKYPSFRPLYISRVIHGVAGNVGGPSRQIYNDLSYHFTRSVQQKRIRNLNNTGIPKKILRKNPNGSGPNIRTNQNHIKNILYAPYIEHFFANPDNDRFKPKKTTDNSIVELNSNIQLILNIMFFINVCAGSIHRYNTIGSFTIKKSYLSHIFICYLIQSIVDLCTIPNIKKNIIKYQLYTLLTDDDFNSFKNSMISLYTAIHGLTEHDYYDLDLNLIIQENNKIFQHFINKDMDTEDLSNIINTYYYRNNIAALTGKNKKIMNMYLIHNFMLNHTINREITSSESDKDHLKRILQIMDTTGYMRIENIRTILNNFIDSLDNNEIKIFVACLTGSTMKPTIIKFATNQASWTNNIALAYHFTTCFYSWEVGYNFTNKGPETIATAPYNQYETIIYNMLIRDRADNGSSSAIYLMRTTLANGGFQLG